MMNIAPFANSGLVIQIHTIAAFVALILGALVLFREKGTPTHKMFGKVWVGLMLLVVVTSFFIHTLKVWGDFSPIHLISIFTLFSLGLSVQAARSGQIKTHQRIMKGIYWGGLVITGLLTLFPGRILNKVFLPDNALPIFSITTSIWLALLTVFFGLAYGFWKQSRDQK